MNRRDFLRRSALVAGGAVAADQVELLEKLGGWVRRFFPSADLSPYGRSPLEPMLEHQERLAEMYRRTTTQLYRTYVRRVDEYSWFETIGPAGEIIVGSGAENRIPLEILREPHPHIRALVADARAIDRLKLRSA